MNAEGSMLAPWHALPDWPAFGFADDVRPALRRSRQAGLSVALATIVDLEGGGPRPVGAQMLISQAEVCGFLSGGCVEADVVLHASRTIEDGAPRRLVYGQGSPWPDIRLLCGARMEVLVERLALDDEAVGYLLDAADRRRPAYWLSDGRKRLCAGAAPPVWPGAALRIYWPALRLVVLGQDPTAMAIASLGAQSGMETWLLRHQGPVAPPGLPGVRYRRDDAARALQELAPDSWTAVAIANHDAELDLAALIETLRSSAFYVGLLGARRHLPARLDALAAAGLGKATLARLRAPIGLDIGGKAPWEIAVSVIAEVMAVWRADDQTAPASLCGASARSHAL